MSVCVRPQVIIIFTLFKTYISIHSEKKYYRLILKYYALVIGSDMINSSIHNNSINDI